MATKAVRVTDIPNHTASSSSSFYSSSSLLFQDNDDVDAVVVRAPPAASKFMVIGHRGNGMNNNMQVCYSSSSSSDRRRSKKASIKENSILSFNAAGNYPIDFVEFDVQVTKDSCPIVFHDNFIITDENGTITERRVTELSLAEFLTYGPQRDPKDIGKTLLRKAKDGSLSNWEVEVDDSLCTLQEVFQNVNSSLGFNIELKFDDYIDYQEEELTHVLQAILRVVFECAKERPVIFSSFQPDAAQLMKKLQNIYPVYFLTEGGSKVYPDMRRNSLDEAIKLCLENGLQGIVSEVKGIFRTPGAITRVKESNLSLLSYGQLNNVAEAVYMQHLMGVDGVIVDLVQEITEAVSDIIKPNKECSTEAQERMSAGREGQSTVAVPRPNFSQRELSFLLKLIPELVQH